MHLTSNAFEHGAEIPRKYTKDGEDVSPPLAWDGLPDGTRSLALIVDDPDAPDPAHPQRTWVHWVLVDVPPATGGLREGARPPGHQGLNDWQHSKYEGPAPPKGRHRYFFKLYALDRELRLDHHPTKDEVLRAMKGHVLAEAQLVGTYRR